MHGQQNIKNKKVLDLFVYSSRRGISRKREIKLSTSNMEKEKLVNCYQCRSTVNDTCIKGNTD